MREYNDILRTSSPEKSFKINERYKNVVVDNPDDAREIDNEDKSLSFRNYSIESSDLQSVPIENHHIQTTDADDDEKNVIRPAALTKIDEIVNIPLKPMPCVQVIDGESDEQVGGITDNLSPSVVLMVEACSHPK